MKKKTTAKAPKRRAIVTRVKKKPRSMPGASVSVPISIRAFITKDPLGYSFLLHGVERAGFESRHAAELEALGLLYDLLEDQALRDDAYDTGEDDE